MVQSRIKCSGSIKWKTFPSHCVDDLMKGLQLKANVMVGLGFMYRINRKTLIPYLLTFLLTNIYYDL